jgi:LPXTG-site transpeptidase (sortase) family protein
VLLFVVYELVGTNLSEERSQAHLAREFSSLVQVRVQSVKAPAKARGVKTAKANRGGAGKVPSTPGTSTRVVDGVALPVPPPGGALDHMIIPAIGVNRYVVQGVAENDLQMGPGHYVGTPLPGQAGNVGIAGHRTTFGAPFFRLNELVSGDYIYLTDTSGTTWVYSVRSQSVVSPSDVAVLAPSHEAELTLTTCNPRFEATSRLVVTAVLAQRLAKGTKLPGHLLPAAKAVRQTGSSSNTSSPRATRPPATTTTSPGATTTTSPGATTTTSPGATTTTTAGALSRPTAGDNPTVGVTAGSVSQSSGGTGTWLALSGWGALALIGWVVTRVLAAHRYRYAKVLVLVVGSLVCLVPLWFAFENIVDLLPANI